MLQTEQHIDHTSHSCQTCGTLHRAGLSTLARLNYDPTRTTTLRNQFSRQMGKRFRELRGVIRRKIVDDDCFGMMNPHAYRQDFDFPRSGDKVNAFMDWLNEQERQGILEIRPGQQVGEAVENAWTNQYVESAYQKGVYRARQELINAGYPVPGLEETGGIDQAFNQPFHVDRVGTLYTRVFRNLKGITDNMDDQISRVLSQAMAEGKHPREMAKLLTRTISGPVGDLALTDTLGRFIPAERRARVLARTEVIRAHHMATVQEYRNWGAEGVRVRAEWSTAGDGRVCAECAMMEGREFSLREIEGMLPAHPQCRCIALPKDVTDEGAPRQAEVPEETFGQGNIPNHLLPNDIRREFAEGVNQDGLERSILLDSDNNRLTDVIVGEEEAVGGFHPLMDTPNARLTTIHVHPELKSFSSGDIKTLARYPGLERMIVVMPDSSAQMMIKKGSRNAIINRADDLYNTRRMELIDDLSDGKITKAEMKRKLDEYRDDILRTLDEEDLIDVWDETGLIKRAEEVVEETQTLGPVDDAVRRVRPDSEFIQTFNASRLDIRKAWVEGEHAQFSSYEAFDEYFDNAVREAVKDSKIVIRVPSKGVLPKILKEGRLKNQYETGTSGGFLNYEMRRNFENRYFGYTDDISDTERPVYGMLARSPENASGGQYGDAVIVYKDRIKKKATWTGGDSLDETGRGTNGRFLPSPVNDPSKDSLTFSKPVVADVEIDKKYIVNKIGRSDGYDSMMYTEVQIHGEALVDDIEEIIFTKGPPGKGLTEQLKKLGISWRQGE